MLYIDPNYITEGRSKLWRVFADDHAELAMLARGFEAPITAMGTPGEHVVLTTSEKNKVTEAKHATRRDIVKLIRRKRRGLPPPPSAEESAAFDAALADADIKLVEGSNPDMDIFGGFDHYDDEDDADQNTRP